MIRREFIKTSMLAGSLAAVPLLGSCGKATTTDSPGKLTYDFRTYRDTDTLCPVYRITPDDGYYLHTFYDICPWRPSQRYLA